MDVTRIIEISMGQKGSKYITFDSIGNEDCMLYIRTGILQHWNFQRFNII